MSNQPDNTQQQEQVSQKTHKIRKDSKKRLYKFPVPKTKFELIRAILVRWWYGMPLWPQKEDYTNKLLEKKLIECTESEAQKIEENIDGIKVFKLDNYPGMYSNASGVLFDLRNDKDKPCFSTLRKMENKDLAKLLEKCIKGQIQALIDSPYYENNLDYALRKFLRRFTRVYKPFLD